jgi:hypothetical protein
MGFHQLKSGKTIKLQCFEKKSAYFNQHERMGLRVLLFTYYLRILNTMFMVDIL